MIRAALPLLCVALLAVLPLPAHAQVKQGNVTETDLKTAEDYAAWAKMFGQGTLASIAVDEERARLMMEFIGDDETLENWTKMVTINVFGLPPAAADQDKMMFGYISGFRSYVLGLKDSGKAVELKGFSGFSKTPKDVPDSDAPPPRHASYHFAIGTDKPDEDNAGIIFPLDARLINFQVQRRNGKTVSTEETAMLHNFLMSQMNGTADMPAPATPPAQKAPGHAQADTVKPPAGKADAKTNNTQKEEKKEK